MAATNSTSTPPAREPLVLLAAAALGGALLALGRRERKRGALTQLTGLTLIGLAARPLVEEQVRRAGAKRRALSAHASVDIGRPVSDVFRFFKDFENFPRLVGGIRAVVDYEDGRSHWEVYTPSGSTLAYDAEVTKYVPNAVIAWASNPGSPVDASVTVRFRPLSPTSTRLDVDVSYSPAETHLSDAVRALLAPRASRRLRDGLEQARAYLESRATFEPSDAPPPPVGPATPL